MPIRVPKERRGDTPWQIVDFHGSPNAPCEVIAQFRTADVAFYDHGSVIMVAPLTPAAREWVAENVELEAWQWIGEAFSCEPRMVENLRSGMAEAGLDV